MFSALMLPPRNCGTERSNSVIILSQKKIKGVQKYAAKSTFSVGPHYPVKREGGLEQTRVYGHAVVYANTDRADGRVEAILPELGVFGKRPKSTGQYHHS